MDSSITFTTEPSKADINEIATWLFSDSDGTHHDWKEIKYQLSNNQNWVLRFNRKAIGFITFTSCDDKVTIDNAAINSIHKRKGYGRRLFNEFKSFAISNNTKIIELTYVDEISGLFWSSLGFKEDQFHWHDTQMYLPLQQHLEITSNSSSSRNRIVLTAQYTEQIKQMVFSIRLKKDNITLVEPIIYPPSIREWKMEVYIENVCVFQNSRLKDVDGEYYCNKGFILIDKLYL